MKVSISNYDSDRDYSSSEDVDLNLSEEDMRNIRDISKTLENVIPNGVKSLTINIQLAVNQSVHGDLKQSSDKY